MQSEQRHKKANEWKDGGSETTELGEDIDEIVIMGIIHSLSVVEINVRLNGCSVEMVAHTCQVVIVEHLRFFP